MEFQCCKICGEYGFEETHHCPPLWWVSLAEDDYNYDDGVEPQPIYAHFASSAAVKFGEDWDEEYSLLSGNEIKVVVARSDEPARERVFIVSGKMVPEYESIEVGSKEKSNGKKEGEPQT